MIRENANWNEQKEAQIKVCITFIPVVRINNTSEIRLSTLSVNVYACAPEEM
jgi:hypothetical protein